MRRLPLAARRAVWDIVGYEPSPEQMRMHRSGAQKLLLAGGWSSGKSYSPGMEMLAHVLCPGERRYHLFGATYREPRSEFTYILEGIQKIDPGLLVKSELSMPKEGAWRLRVVSGGELMTVSAEDALSIRAFTSDGVMLCEAGILGIDVFEAVLGRLIRTGGFLLISGTFEGSVGWYADYFTMGQGPNEMGLESFSMPSWSNLKMFPGGRQDPLILDLEKSMSREAFMEKCAALPCPPKGAVFGGYFRVDLHVKRDLEWVPGEAVYLAVDPGTQHAYAVEAVQVIDGEVRGFDEVYEFDKVTDDIIDIVYDPVARPWCRDIRFGVMDVAGTYRQGASIAAAETWRIRKGLIFTGQKVPVTDGIEVMKTFLKPNPITGRPKVVFSPRCVGILSELGATVSPFDRQRHVYSWGTDKAGVVYGTVPIDRWNDGIKAMTYFMVDHFGYTGAAISRQPHAIITYPSRGKGRWQHGLRV